LIGQKAKAAEALNQILEIVSQDDSSFSKSGDLLEIADRYQQLGDIPKADALLIEAGEASEKIEKLEDKIERFVQIADNLIKIGQIEKASETAGEALDLCGMIADKRSLVYLLGRIALSYIKLENKNKAAELVSAISKVIQESKVKTSGLGPIAVDLALADACALALRLASLIKEPEVKVEALSIICRSLAEAKLESLDEIEKIVRKSSYRLT
jgi:tetratricopeptide (TPR) repeat protein